MYISLSFPYFRTLHLGIWFRTQGTVSKNFCVVVVDLAVERLKENSSTRGWYRLFRPTAGKELESDYIMLDYKRRYIVFAMVSGNVNNKKEKSDRKCFLLYVKMEGVFHFDL